MLDRNSKDLSNILSDDFTLTHMTGNVQSKKDWLKDIDSGLMVTISRKGESGQITFPNEEATLIDWNQVDAAIYGGRGTLNLQLTVEFKKENSSWIAQKMEATTF